MTGGLEIYLDKYDQIMRTVILIHFRVMAFGWVEHPHTRDITCNPENGNQITFNPTKLSFCEYCPLDSNQGCPMPIYLDERIPLILLLLVRSLKIWAMFCEKSQRLYTTVQSVYNTCKLLESGYGMVSLFGAFLNLKKKKYGREGLPVWCFFKSEDKNIKIWEGGSPCLVLF